MALDPGIPCRDDGLLESRGKGRLAAIESQQGFSHQRPSAGKGENSLPSIQNSTHLNRPSSRQGMPGSSAMDGKASKK